MSLTWSQEVSFPSLVLHFYGTGCRSAYPNLPFAFESLQSGIGDAAAFRSRVWCCWTLARWVNGQFVGSHESGRADDPPADRFIRRGKQYRQLKSRGISYTRTTIHTGDGGLLLYTTHRRRTRKKWLAEL